jgi:hypothetical protein
MATNGVNTVTPANPQAKAEELASVSKTLTFTVEVNADDFNYLFTYKYAKNWFGILPQAKIEAHKQDWLSEQLASKMAAEVKQIKKAISNKIILAEHGSK